MNSALDSAELIIIDGANGVTREPRLQFPHAGESLAAVVVGVLLVITLRRFKPSLVAPVIIAAALPGLATVAFLRADAPLARPALAAQVSATLQSMQSTVQWPRAVRVTHENDDVLFPLGRYAVPTRVTDPKTASQIELELYGAQLEARCEGETRIVCGAKP